MGAFGTLDRATVVRSTPVERLDLTGKRLTVVGGTNGLGQAIARQALALGAGVTVVGRTLRDAPHKRLRFVQADLSSMSGAVRLGEELPAEDEDVVLFTNGITAAKLREETSEGVERDMAVSYLSRYALLQGLHERIGVNRPTSSPRARVFVMAGPGGDQDGNPADLNALTDYNQNTAHMNTVAANEALTINGANATNGPAYFGLNPGLIKTDIRANYLGAGSFAHKATEALVGLLAQSPQTYARRIVPVLFTHDLNHRTGVMFDRKARPIRPSLGMTPNRVESFMTASDSLLRRVVG
ncbi:SDR family NAD(P)-dependent oxidoreductase [Kutzneria sp. 744]|uniref:SDR family NAD(P)-dependent oxidoreductase n=1 Tax=Kutzneria sp. (strain 744) TaxID=345341 RepID=UPI0003EEB7B0|nr:SDR family NAD(P)-dependent oxidoreductase [Kutzneria sp. 744]EWM10308.1 oxidoreductase [Kutzneria sp. 744]